MVWPNRFFKDLFASNCLSEFMISLVAVFLALVIGGVLIFLSGHDVWAAWGSLFGGIFGNLYNVSQLLLKTIPLLFTGLAVAIGFKSGLFNIGCEGQLYWGALATAAFSLSFPGASGLFLIPLSLLAGMLAGGLWGFVPGYLKSKTGAHEVVTTIMMNYIGILATSLVLRRYFREPGPIEQTPMIPEAARMAELIPFTRLTWSILLGVAVVVLVDLFFKKTALGFELRMVGENPPAAEYAGINLQRSTIISMGLSGAVAALAGSTMVMGELHRFVADFSPGYGFTGIAVAVLGRNRPLGVLLSAVLFGALETGGISMQLFAKIPMDLMTVIQGLVILFVAAPGMVRVFVRFIDRPRPHRANPSDPG